MAKGTECSTALSVRILVAIKHVCDPDQASRLRLLDGGHALDCSGLDRFANPFDEYALEAALRLTENGETRQRHGEVIAVSFGDEGSELVLRNAMALGAAKAIRVATSDDDLDAHLLATALARVARMESVDLVLLGKQTVDGDGNEVAQRVAGLMELPQLTSVAAIQELPDGTLIAAREVDVGLLRVRTRPPAVISVDLRIVLPLSVHSHQTPPDFAYPSGLRFAPLPAIIMAKRKQLEVLPLSVLIGSARRALTFTNYELQTKREGCTLVEDVDQLVACLAERAPALLKSSRT